MGIPAEHFFSTRKVSFQTKHSLIFFILFPAITMMLGWGLRSFIGGGPYGAMIPGALVMIAFCLLLDIPVSLAATAIVFGTVGIAMGDTMTYSQTIGFLHKSNGVLWGFTGTSVKGGVWGLLSGLFIGFGLMYQRMKFKTILIGFLIFLTGFVLGLKLINDPKVIYFSDPFNKPRSEFWAGFLLGATGLLIYLKTKINAEDWKVILRFVVYGSLGGMLGFGLGSLWITFGFRYGAAFMITDWWKVMEFTFGFILGAFLGFAAWKSQNVDVRSYRKKEIKINYSFSIEVIAFILIGFFVFATLELFNTYLKIIKNNDGLCYGILFNIGRVIINYAFVGCMLIIIALRWPFLSFQIAVSLTFSHSMIDLIIDDGLFHKLQSLPLVIIAILLGTALIVGVLVGIFQRKRLVLKSMFLILLWSTIIVAMARMIADGTFNFSRDHSFARVVFGDLFVFGSFIISAVIISVFLMRTQKPDAIIE